MNDWKTIEKIVNTLPQWDVIKLIIGIQEELIKEYNKNEYIDIANYFDDWGELLDVIENLLKRLKEKGE